MLLVPLLIGGATTSNKHTAVKIAPAYSGPTLHVKDASRATGVMGALMSAKQKEDLVKDNRELQARMQTEYEDGKDQRPLISYADAKVSGVGIDWAPEQISTPEFTGVKLLKDLSLGEIVPYIDWGPFFHVWEMRGGYPRIFEDPEQGKEARKLFDEAQAMLKLIVDEKWLRAEAVYGFFPANSEGDDLIVFEDDARKKERMRFHTLRQQQKKRRKNTPYCALSDFVAPVSTGFKDYLGGFAVTCGIQGRAG